MDQAEVRKAVLEDVDLLLGVADEWDLAPLMAITETTVEDLLASSIQTQDVRAGLIHGELACLFGSFRQTLLSSDLFVWIVGSRILRKYPLILVKNYRRYLEEFENRGERLISLLDFRNEQAVRWAIWLGFIPENVVQYGRPPRSYLKIYREKPSCKLSQHSSVG